MEEQKINVSISDGEAQFAHEMSLNFNPTQFIFDFKTVTPRIDVRSQEGACIAIKHNVVLVEPYHAKQIYTLLGKVISKYEEEFGIAQKPKAVEIAEAKQRTLQSKLPKKESETSTIPTYLG